MNTFSTTYNSLFSTDTFLSYSTTYFLPTSYLSTAYFVAQPIKLAPQPISSPLSLSSSTEQSSRPIYVQSAQHYPHLIFTIVVLLPGTCTHGQPSFITNPAHLPRCWSRDSRW